jgi:hypothetical protein
MGRALESKYPQHSQQGTLRAQTENKPEQTYGPVWARCEFSF